MNTFFLALLSVVALALCGVREDSPAARKHRASLRDGGWRRIVWLVVQALAGVVVLLVVTALRTSTYGVLLAVATGAAWLASLIALDRRTAYVDPLELRP